MNVAYAISGSAIAGAVSLAVYHELPPVRIEPAALNETVAVKSDPEPPLSHPVRTIPIVASPVVAPIITPAITPAAPPSDVEIPLRQVGQENRHTKPKPRGDVCARHGGHRVDDAARRSWHCVFPKRGSR